MVFDIKTRVFWSFFAVFGRDFDIFDGFWHEIDVFWSRFWYFWWFLASKWLIFDGFEHKILIFCSIFALWEPFLIKITTFLLVFCSKLLIFDGFWHEILIFCFNFALLGFFSVIFACFLLVFDAFLAYFCHFLTQKASKLTLFCHFYVIFHHFLLFCGKKVFFGSFLAQKELKLIKNDPLVGGGPLAYALRGRTGPVRGCTRADGSCPRAWETLIDEGSRVPICTYINARRKSLDLCCYAQEFDSLKIMAFLCL